MKKIVLAALASTVAMVPNAASLAAPSTSVSRYRLDVAPFHQGANYGLVTGWNNAGHAVYQRPIPGAASRESFWWNGVEEIELLTDAVASRAVVHDLDDNGVAVGERIRGFRQLAMIWEQGTPRDLGTLGGEQSDASAINDDGVIAGWSEVASGELHLFTWNGAFTDHGPLPPGCCYAVNAINNSGQVVGHDDGSLLRGWLFDGARFIALPDLTGTNDSTPRDINNWGLAVGASYPDQANQRPVTWIDGQVQALPFPSEALRGAAVAINERNEIVGSVVFPDPMLETVLEAMLWKDDDAFLLRDVVANLGDWQLQRAEDINDRGQILVYAVSATDSRRRVVLTPVPEPSGAVLALVGLVAAWYSREQPVAMHHIPMGNAAGVVAAVSAAAVAAR